MDPLDLKIQSDSSDAQSNIDDLINSLNQLNDSITNLNGATRQATDNSYTFGDALGQIGSIVAAIGITNFIGNIIGLGEAFVQTSFQAAESLQNMGITMGYVFGDQGTKVMQFIDDLINKSGLLSRTSLENLSIQMSNLHLPFATFQKDLTDIANVASGAGGSADRMNQILEVTGRVMAIAGQAGSVPTLYFKQLERLVPGILEALSQVTEKPVTAFRSLSKNIIITANDFTKALDVLSGTKYAGALEAQGNTIAGFLGRIQSTFMGMVDSILGEEPTGVTTGGSVFDLINKSLKEFLGYLDANKGAIQSWFKNELKIFLDYVIAHKVDIENFFKNINKELISFGNWVSTNKQTIETLLSFVTGIANAMGYIGNLHNQPHLSLAQQTAAIPGIGQFLVPSSQQTNNSKNYNINMHNTINNNTDTQSLLAEMNYNLNRRP